MGYSSARFGVNFGGVEARGFDDSVDIEWEVEDSVTAEADARGEHGILVFNNKTKGTAKVTLLANSPTCAIWVSLFEQARKAGKGLPLGMYDRNTDTAAFAFASEASLTKAPKFSRGTGKPVVEFNFVFAACQPPLIA